MTDNAISAIVTALIVFGVTLAARIALESRRGTLNVKREMGIVLGGVVGLALFIIVIFGPSPYARLLVPIFFIVTGVLLLAFPGQRGNFMNIRVVGLLSIFAGLLWFLPVLVSPLLAFVPAFVSALS